MLFVSVWLFSAVFGTTADPEFTSLYSQHAQTVMRRELSDLRQMILEIESEVSQFRHENAQFLGILAEFHRAYRLINHLPVLKCHTSPEDPWIRQLVCFHFNYDLLLSTIEKRGNLYSSLLSKHDQLHALNFVNFVEDPEIRGRLSRRCSLADGLWAQLDDLHELNLSFVRTHFGKPEVMRIFRNMERKIDQQIKRTEWQSIKPKYSLAHFTLQLLSKEQKQFQAVRTEALREITALGVQVRQIPASVISALANFHALHEQILHPFQTAPLPESQESVFPAVGNRKLKRRLWHLTDLVKVNLAHMQFHRERLESLALEAAAAADALVELVDIPTRKALREIPMLLEVFKTALTFDSRVVDPGNFIQNVHKEIARLLGEINFEFPIAMEEATGDPARAAIIERFIQEIDHTYDKYASSRLLLGRESKTEDDGEDEYAHDNNEEVEVEEAVNQAIEAFPRMDAEFSEELKKFMVSLEHIQLRLPMTPSLVFEPQNFDLTDPPRDLKTMIAEFSKSFDEILKQTDEVFAFVAEASAAATAIDEISSTTGLKSSLLGDSETNKDLLSVFMHALNYSGDEIHHRYAHLFRAWQTSLRATSLVVSARLGEVADQGIQELLEGLSFLENEKAAVFEETISKYFELSQE